MTKRYLLDTQTILHYLQGVQPVVDRLHAHAPCHLSMSIMTYVELKYIGKVYLNKKRARIIEKICGYHTLRIFDFTTMEAGLAAGMIARVKKAGEVISLADGISASIACTRDRIFVSSVPAMRHLPEMQTEAWI